MNLPVFQIAIQKTEDLDRVRHYAKHLASLAGLSAFDQARLATALAEIAFNALRHAGGGSVELAITEQGRRQFVRATVVDHGPGIVGLEEILGQATGSAGSPRTGLAAARKLVDRFSIDSHPQTGTVVMLDKAVGSTLGRVTEVETAAWAETLRNDSTTVISTLPAQQNRELYDALAALRQQERNLKRQLRRVQQLNDKLDVLSLVASNTDHSVVITDRNGLIEWVNDGFGRITGYDPFEVVGKKPGELLQGPLSDPQTVERIGAGLRSGESFTEEILNYHKDGHTYWIAMNIFPVRDKRGNVVRFMAIQNDVTSHRQTEKDLHTAKDAAEKANRAKSELLANMSHEIRTPMNAVIGMTDLLFDTTLTGEQLEYLSIVKESAHSLLRLLDDILDFSKIEAGKLHLDAVPFNLRDTLAATMKSFAQRAEEKRLHLACDVAPNVPDRVVGDPQRWRQVLTNLVGNAIKFTLAGEVVVRLELASQSDATVQIRGLVRDTGIGIPADKLEHIFESFAQADSSMTRRFGGTGLGLTITAQLVAMMGGRVWVESREGTGSTFAFTASFALTPTPEAVSPAVDHPQTQPVPQRPAPARRLTVLVAEDIPANQKLIQRILEKRGHEAVLAADGLEALALFRQQPFDAVLMDVQMPEQDGLRTAAAIRELEQASGRRTPIIAVTAHAQVADRQACLTSGMDAYLAKPLDARDVISIVEGLAGISGPPSKRPAARRSARTAAAFDFQTALARMEDDLELFAQLSQFFLEDGPSLLCDIEQACRQRDPPQLERAAHNLKGLVRNFEAREASLLAERLESLGRQGKTTGAQATCRQLRAEVERLIAALRDFHSKTIQAQAETTG